MENPCASNAAMDTKPLGVPFAVGLKVTLIVQLAPFARSYLLQAHAFASSARNVALRLADARPRARQ